MTASASSSRVEKGNDDPRPQATCRPAMAASAPAVRYRAEEGRARTGVWIEVVDGSEVQSSRVGRAVSVTVSPCRVSE
jgi:hypothetical protein